MKFCWLVESFENAHIIKHIWDASDFELHVSQNLLYNTSSSDQHRWAFAMPSSLDSATKNKELFVLGVQLESELKRFAKQSTLKL